MNIAIIQSSDSGVVKSCTQNLRRWLPSTEHWRSEPKHASSGGLTAGMSTIGATSTDALGSKCLFLFCDVSGSSFLALARVSCTTKMNWQAAETQVPAASDHELGDRNQCHRGALALRL